MKIQPDFAERVSALAESTPREAVANLLRAMLPPQPVRVRSYEPAPASAEAAPPPPVARDPFAKLMRGPRPLRTRRTRTRAYRVLNPYGHGNHRRGTWRAAMVEAIVRCEESTEAGALAYLERNYPHLASKGVDLAFAESVGYITFN